MVIPRFFVPYFERIGLTDRQQSYVVEQMSQPHRHYHTLGHLSMMLNKWMLSDTLYGEIVIAAIIFHDIIYDPTSKTNEEDSAVEAKMMLSEKNFLTVRDHPDPVAEVVRFILATKQHKLPVDPSYFSREWFLRDFLERDLGILWTPNPRRYAWYAHGVRREYQHVSNADYRKGRAQVLESLGKEINLMSSEAWRQQWERNLKWEIENLERGTFDV